MKLKPVFVLISTARPAVVIVISPDGRTHSFEETLPRRSSFNRPDSKRKPLSPDDFRGELLK